MDPSQEDENIPFIDEKEETVDSKERRNSKVSLEMDGVNASEKGETGITIESTLFLPIQLNDNKSTPITENDNKVINSEVVTPTPPLSPVESSYHFYHPSFPNLPRDLRNGEEKRTSFKYYMHSAAEKGQVKKLQSLLQKGDPLLLDFKQRTPLHYASGFPYQKKAMQMVDDILGCPLAQNCDSYPNKKQTLIDFQDKNGETALHIAARTGHRELAEKLIFAAADVNLRDNKGVEPLELIYSKVPAALKPVFDGAVECKVGDRRDQNLIVRFDFGSIVGYPLPTDDLTIFKTETKLLSFALQQSEQKRAAIVLHPIVQVFLFLKWKKIRILLWISILYHMIWLLLYTLFITDLYLIQCPYIIEEVDEEDSHLLHENATLDVHLDGLNNSQNVSTSGGGLTMDNYLFVYLETNATEKTCEIGMNLFSSLSMELSFLFCVSVSVAMKEMYEIYSTPLPKFYFSQLENVGQWLLIAVIALTSLPIFTGNVENTIIIHAWQYQLAAMGIFLAWALILSQIGKIPRFGIYIEILGKVLRSFTMFMITFASLLVAFTVAFQIIMPQKVGFENFPFGFIKVMIMMTGEVGYDEVFYSDDTSSQIPFPTATKLLYAAFVSVVTIILFNLLIGLTVSDIQGLQHVAKLSSLSSQLEQIYLMERFIVSKKLQNFLKRINKNHWIRFFLVTQQTDDLETNMGLDIHISKIPMELQFEVREVAIPNYIQDKDEDDEDDTAPVNDEDETSSKSSKNSNSLSRVPQDELKIQIKNILKELLDEIKEEHNNKDQCVCKK